MTQDTSTKLTAVMPTMTVNDIHASIAWYHDVMGFSVAREMEHDGQLMGAVVAAGAVQFMLGQDDFAKGKDRPKGVASRLYCIYEGDIDEFADAIKSRGGALEQEPTDQPWGARDFAVKDPDGFTISISTGAGEDG
jgi:uncharacterized glyoxalase superfamily protein PhnB